MVGSFRAQNFQKSKKCHDMPRKWFHFKPLTPTHPGGAVLGDTGRKVGGGRREEWRREGGGETGGRTNEQYFVHCWIVLWSITYL